MSHLFCKDKTFLVTGGAGSIGSALVRKLLELSPKSIRVYDIDETRLFDLEESIQSKKLRILVGDIRDQERLKRALEGVDIILHAAALKHVPLCEYNPFEAVKTNVVGTQNVINASLDANVDKMILISTDKAVNPVNVMGATKLLAERLTISANNYKGSKKTVFSCVRFGNVLNSRGSVIPTFVNEIQHGGPITITDLKMTRFVMSIPNATDLILKAVCLANGGEIFILKMPSLRISDLADVMIEQLAPKYGRNPSDIKATVIGRRSGEKIYEELITPDEAQYVEDKCEFYSLDRALRNHAISCAYTSETTKILNKNEIKKLLAEIGLIPFL
jgi:FlaA1/EpsC-like NDP-sugar epimerase